MLKKNELVLDLLISVGKSITLKDNPIKVPDNAFGFFVKSTVEVLELDEKEIRHRFGISVPTYERWITNKNAPHPVMQVPVVNFFLEKLKKEKKLLNENIALGK